MKHEEFIALLTEEVKAAEQHLADNGNINGIVLSHEDNETNVKWRIALDKAFSILADFARENGIADE